MKGPAFWVRTVRSPESSSLDLIRLKVAHVACIACRGARPDMKSPCCHRPVPTWEELQVWSARCTFNLLKKHGLCPICKTSQEVPARKQTDVAVFYLCRSVLFPRKGLRFSGHAHLRSDLRAFGIRAGDVGEPQKCLLPGHCKLGIVWKFWKS